MDGDIEAYEYEAMNNVFISKILKRFIRRNIANGIPGFEKF